MLAQQNATLPKFQELEYQRITEEIAADRALQFRMFYQALTFTAIILTFGAYSIRGVSEFIETCGGIANGIKYISFAPYITLIPLIILIPSLDIIINRARTYNRKSAYLMLKFHKYDLDGSWELSLARFRKTPHTSGYIRNMCLVIILLETVFLLFFFVASVLFIVPHLTSDLMRCHLLVSGLIVISLFFWSCALILNKLLLLKFKYSIQACVIKWLSLLISGFPSREELFVRRRNRTLVETIDEYMENWFTKFRKSQNRFAWILKLEFIDRQDPSEWNSEIKYFNLLTLILFFADLWIIFYFSNLC